MSSRRIQQPTVVRNEGFELVSELQGAGDMESIQRSHATRHQGAGSLHQLAAERDAINAIEDPPCGIYEFAISSKGCTQDLRDRKLACHTIGSPPQISAQCRGFGFGNDEFHERGRVEVEQGSAFLGAELFQAGR